MEINSLIYSVFILQAIESRNQVDDVYIDVSKGFNKLNYNLLLNKLAGIAH